MYVYYIWPSCAENAIMVSPYLSDRGISLILNARSTDGSTQVCAVLIIVCQMMIQAVCYTF